MATRPFWGLLSDPQFSPDHDNVYLPFVVDCNLFPPHSPIVTELKKEESFFIYRKNFFFGKRAHALSCTILGQPNN
jgi:hypothetical protein